MQIVLDKQGYVDSYALIGGFGTPSVAVDEPVDIKDFEDNYRSYHLSDDGKLIKSVDRQLEIEYQIESANLRVQREKVCFPIINRGTLWYDCLSDEQKDELAVWYHAWLSVTDTRFIPEMPEWLF